MKIIILKTISFRQIHTFSVGQVLHVRDKALDVRLWVCLLLQAAVNFSQEIRHNLLHVSIAQDKLFALLSDLFGRQIM